MKYLGVDHFVGPPPANQLANSEYAERTSQLVRTLAWLVPPSLANCRPVPLGGGGSGVAGETVVQNGEATCVESVGCQIQCAFQG